MDFVTSAVQTLAEADLQIETVSAQLETLKQQRAALATLLAEEMVNRGVPRITVGDRTCYTRSTFRANKAAGVTTEEVARSLRECGLGDIVSEAPSYVPATLEAALREVWKQQQDALPGADPCEVIPPALRGKINVAVLTDVALRKR